MKMLSSRVSWLALAALVALTGCPEVPSADPLPVAPSISSFTSSAAEVAVGGKVTLTWKVTNATSVKIDEVRLGTVSGVSGNEGSVEVSISDASLFVLTARNDRGASDTAVVAVRVAGALGALQLSALPESIKAGETTTLAWTAPGATSVTLTADPGGAVDVGAQLVAGAVRVSPTTTTTYTLTADNRTATATVTVLPTLVSFTASSLSADAGSTVTLSWVTANASRVQLSTGGRGYIVDETDAAKVAMGSLDDTLPAQVDPGQVFTYRLTVTGAGTTLEQDLVISVSGNPAVLTFTAPELARSLDAGVLADGGTGPATIRLAWTTREAAGVSISANGTEFYRAPPSLLATGAVDVATPAEDTTYTLTATGARGGSDVKTASVDVVGKPSITLAAMPATLAAGGDVTTLSWSGTDVRQVSVREVGFGAVFGQTGAAAGSGMLPQTPNANTTYEIVASNGVGDSVSATTSVTVTTPVSLSVAQTGALRFGQNVEVSWTAPGDIVGLPHTTVTQRAASFDDIATTGTKLVFPSTGNSAAIISPDFRMVLFGKSVGDTVYVTQNGYLTFGIANGKNSTDEALPTGRIEQLSVAPYWESLTVGAGVFWQIKEVGGVRALIVQWNTTSATFQAKLFANGQIDFDYGTMPSTIAGRTGVVGETHEQTVIAAAAGNTGLTFFGPKSSPVSLPVFTNRPLAGSLVVGQAALRLSTGALQVVRPMDFHVNEVMAASTFGVPGTWVELRNTLATPVPLDGWSFQLADGGAIPLTGTVPSRGVLVVGASVDPALNGDAGVAVAIPNFDLTGQTSLVLSRNGLHDSVSLAGIDAGQALTHDLGPIAYSDSRATGVADCVSTSTYGSQRGTPGVDQGCFGYSVSSTLPGFFDISMTGTTMPFTTFDNQVQTADLSAAPFTYFGTQYSSATVSTNGFIGFVGTVGVADYLSPKPSISAPNGLIAIFGADLATGALTPSIHSKRVGANEDPFAAAPHWIFQWRNYSRYLASDVLQFQMKLFDDGAIEFHYDSMLSGSSSQYGAGGDSVVALENLTGTEALVISADSATPGIKPFSAYRFVPR